MTTEMDQLQGESEQNYNLKVGALAHAIRVSPDSCSIEDEAEDRRLITLLPKLAVQKTFPSNSEPMFSGDADRRIQPSSLNSSLVQIGPENKHSSSLLIDKKLIESPDNSSATLPSSVTPVSDLANLSKNIETLQPKSRESLFHTSQKDTVVAMTRSDGPLLRAQQFSLYSEPVSQDTKELSPGKKNLQMVNNEMRENKPASHTRGFESVGSTDSLFLPLGQGSEDSVSSFVELQRSLSNEGASLLSEEPTFRAHSYPSLPFSPGSTSAQNSDYRRQNQSGNSTRQQEFRKTWNISTTPGYVESSPFIYFKSFFSKQSPLTPESTNVAALSISTQIENGPTEGFKIVILCLLWYASSAASNNIAKQIFQSYNYPVTLTFVQFGFNTFFCFLFGYFAGDTRSTLPHTSNILPSSSNTWISLSNGHTGFWRKIIPYQTLRKVIYAFLLGTFWVLSFLFTSLHNFIILLRFWVALGLGIHDEVHHSHNHHKTFVRHFSGTRIRIPCRDVVMMMLPLSAFLISGHIFSSIAISNVAVSFVHTVKALSPLFTVLAYRLFYKTIYPEQVYISLLPLTFGVMLACSFEMSFNFVGLFCALASTWIFVGQNIFSKGLFKERKLDKLNMLLYSSLSSFVLMSPIWLWSEGSQILTGLPISHWLPFFSSPTPPDAQPDFPSAGVFSLFLLNGMAHFGQNVFAFSILSLVSPVTYSIASLVKRIVVIVASMIWFGQHVSIAQGFGILLTFFGLWMYQNAKMSSPDGGLKSAEPLNSPRQDEVVVDFVLKASTSDDNRPFQHRPARTTVH